MDIYRLLRGGRYLVAKRPAPSDDQVEVFVGTTAKYVVHLATGEPTKLRAQYDASNRTWRRVGNAPRSRGKY
jgi:hypothetical protein